MEVKNQCEALSALHENFGMGMDINNIKREFRQWVANQVTNYPVEKNTNVDAATTHDDKFELAIDVYQFKSDEITVKVVNSNTICIEGNYEERNENASFLSRHFVRKYTIPAGFDVEKIVSTLSSDGVLRIMAPRIGKTITASIQTDGMSTTQGSSASVQQNQSNSVRNTQAIKEVDETHKYIQQFLQDANKYQVVRIQQVGPFSKTNDGLQENLSMQQSSSTNTHTFESENTKNETQKYSGVPIVQTKLSSNENVTVQNCACNMKTQEIFQSEEQYEALKNHEYKTIPIQQTNNTTNTEEVSVKKCATNNEATCKNLTESVYTNIPIQQTGMISQVNKVKTNKHSKYSSQDSENLHQEPKLNKVENIETITECTTYGTHNTNDGYKTVPIKQTSTTESNIYQSSETFNDKSVQERRKQDKTAESMKNLHFKTSLEKEIEFTSQVQKSTTKTNNDSEMQNILRSSEEALDKNSCKNLITKTESIEESLTCEVATRTNNQCKNISHAEEILTDVNKTCEGVNKQRICGKQDKDIKEVDKNIVANVVDTNTPKSVLNKRNQSSVEESTTYEIYKSSDYTTVPIKVIDSQTNLETRTASNKQGTNTEIITDVRSCEGINKQRICDKQDKDLKEVDKKIVTNVDDTNTPNSVLSKRHQTSIEESTTYEIYKGSHYTTVPIKVIDSQSNIENRMTLNNQSTNKEIITDVKSCDGINKQKIYDEQDKEVHRKIVTNVGATNTPTSVLNKRNQTSIEESTYEIYKSSDYATVPVALIDSETRTALEKTTSIQEHRNKNLNSFKNFDETNTHSVIKDVKVDLLERDEKINTNVNKPINQEIDAKPTPVADSQESTKILTVLEETLTVQNHENKTLNNLKTSAISKAIDVQEANEKTNTSIENIPLNESTNQVTTYSQRDNEKITVLEGTTSAKNIQRRTSASEEITNINFKTCEKINAQETYNEQNCKSSLNKEVKVLSHQKDENQVQNINAHVTQDCTNNVHENSLLNKQRNLVTNIELIEESTTYENRNTNNAIPNKVVDSLNQTKFTNDSEDTTYLRNTQSSGSQNKKTSNFEEISTQEVYMQNCNAHLGKEVKSTSQMQTETLSKNSANSQTHSDTTLCGLGNQTLEKNSQELVESEKSCNSQTGTDTFTKVTKHQTRTQKTVKNNSNESQYNISTNFEKAENREGDVATTIKSGNATQEYQTFAIDASETGTKNKKAENCLQTHLDESQISKHTISETNNQLNQSQQHNVIFQENDFRKEDVVCDGYQQKGFTNKTAKAEFEAHPHGFKVTNEQSFYTEKTKTKECNSNNPNKQLDQAHNTAYQVQFSVDSNNSERFSRMPSESSEICIEDITEENERKASSTSSGYKRHETSQHVSSSVHTQQN